jgi:hypothetical protein
MINIVECSGSSSGGGGGGDGGDNFCKRTVTRSTL